MLRGISSVSRNEPFIFSGYAILRNCVRGDAVLDLDEPHDHRCIGCISLHYVRHFLAVDYLVVGDSSWNVTILYPVLGDFCHVIRETLCRLD